MATNDLCNELSKDLKIDEVLERRICTAILRQLDDSSNDVQSVAVKCLGILLKKVQIAQVSEICDKLCTLILDGKDALRDIYSIGLKTLIQDVPDEMGTSVAEKLTNRLLQGISRDSSTEDVNRECLDIMSDLLRRFGHFCTRDHDDIMTVVVRQLENERTVIRKRAAVCLGSLAVVSSDVLLNRLVENILDRIDVGRSNGPSVDIRTLIQTVGTISRTTGYRLGRFLDRLIPLFLSFCGNADNEDEQSETANELREHSFPGLESFVLRCPREVTPHLDNILSLSLSFMKYDPNYCYAEEDVDIDEEGYGGSDDDYGGSDDDDTSWKVRKAAVKVVTAIITSRPEMLHVLYGYCAEELISRFKEREENVRLDIFSCFTSLLQSTISSTRINSDAMISVSGDSDCTKATIRPTMKRQRSAVVYLEEKIPMIIRASQKQLQSSSVKTKSAVFAMLRTLVNVVQGSLNENLLGLIDTVLKCLSEKNQTLKLDALSFLRLVFEYHSPSSLLEIVPKVLPATLDASKEDWYKVIAESLRVIGSIIGVIRPQILGDTMDTFDFQAYVNPIYLSILPRLMVFDIDQEIKDCAIYAAGRLLVFLGDYVKPNDLLEVLSILRKRLENEVTRMPALKALSAIATSPLHLDLSSIYIEVVAELSMFLRQQSRVLKQATLITLDAFINCTTVNLIPDSELISTVVKEASNLVNDSDLLLANLSLKVLISVFDKFPASCNTFSTYLLPKALELMHSPLLQGLSHQTLILLLQKFVEAGVPGMALDDIISAMTSVSLADVPRQSISNIAKCIAGICTVVPLQQRNVIVERFSGDLSGVDDAQKHLALLCIGELGYLGLTGELNFKNEIISCFESKAEEIKMAAAYSLGQVAVGNMSIYLPVILSAVESNRNQYLLLACMLLNIFILPAN